MLYVPNDCVALPGLVTQHTPQATPTKAVQFTFTDHSHDHDPPPSGKHHNHDQYTSPNAKHENEDRTTREGAAVAGNGSSEAEGKPQRACKGKRYKEMVAESGLKSFKRERKVKNWNRLV